MKEALVFVVSVRPDRRKKKKINNLYSSLARFARPVLDESVLLIGVGGGGGLDGLVDRNLGRRNFPAASAQNRPRMTPHAILAAQAWRTTVSCEKESSLAKFKCRAGDATCAVLRGFFSVCTVLH